ncbi:MAG: hypothetical protein KDA27_00790 [Candidatus Eisenbacteria bacterium]|uniref:DUF2884 family protein n=1 Tax=Eiseniibacteriota bacterium TaxID=2212470 RepID=A0A956NAE5_UNCEI|nr:hypothetical protein [Candidatus Eisenbacteria bacterium]MCB9462273.1 hypothetical protein [Candidatus Eisenbacteria bacterium]
MYRASWLRVGVSSALLLTLVLTGCAKRVPVEDGAFEAQEKVVLTLSNDRSLEGRIDTGSAVVYTDQGSVYHATIQSVNEKTITLEDAVLERTAGSVEEAALRLADARREVADTVPQITLIRDEIQGVERVGFDGPRTLRNVTYWTLTSTIVSLLLGERS